MQGSEMRFTLQQHAQKITQLLHQARQECRVNIQKVHDPKAQGSLKRANRLPTPTRSEPFTEEF